MVLDGIEKALSDAQPGLHELAILFRNFIYEHEHAQTEGVLEQQLGPLLARMAKVAAQGMLDATADPDHGRDIRNAFMTLIRLHPLSAALKAQAAIAAISQVPVSQVANMRPHDQLFLMTACRFLPDDSKGAWIAHLLSAPSGHIQFAHLLYAVRTMQPGESREHLLNKMREILVVLCAEDHGRARVEFVRVALEIGAGGEDRLAAALVAETQSYDGYPYLHDEERDDIAILSFHLDPDGQLAVPGSEVRETGNARNPEKLTGGTPFEYPDWLAARRKVLQDARPAVNAKPALVENLPNALAEITQAYATSRADVKVADWDGLRDVLVAWHRRG